jgi:hypothetical protein
VSPLPVHGAAIGRCLAARVQAVGSCYDHLAGALSVGLALRLERDQLLCTRDERSYELTPRGADWFAAELGIDVDALLTERRMLARRCLDWTERKPHLAGALGAALLDTLLAQRWLTRAPGSRILNVSARGEAGLARLGVSLEVA